MGFGPQYYFYDRGIINQSNLSLSPSRWAGAWDGTTSITIHSLGLQTSTGRHPLRSVASRCNCARRDVTLRTNADLAATAAFYRVYYEYVKGPVCAYTPPFPLPRYRVLLLEEGLSTTNFGSRQNRARRLKSYWNERRIPGSNPISVSRSPEDRARKGGLSPEATMEGSWA